MSFTSIRSKWHAASGKTSTAISFSENANWQITSAGLMLLSLILALGIEWTSARTKVIPYVVEVDRLSYAMTIPAAEQNILNDLLVHAQGAAQPSRYEHWAEQKYMKALESPQVVAAFHNPSLEIPQSQNQSAGQGFTGESSAGSSGEQATPRAVALYRNGGKRHPCRPRGAGSTRTCRGPIVAIVRERMPVRGTRIRGWGNSRIADTCGMDG